MSKRRVVVTGVGAVTPVGLGREAFWSSVLAGRHGFGPISRFDHTDFAVHFAAEVSDFDPEVVLSAKEARHVDRFTQFAISAADQAVKDSHLDMGKLDPKTIGCVWASGIGGLEEIEKTHRILLAKGPRRVNPFFIPKLMINAAAGHIAIRFGIQSVNYGVASACASGGHALGLALKTIQHGEADVMICGGSEATVTSLCLGGFCSLKALSTRNDDPATASRPFTKGRDGFVVGEGAGGLILEDYEHARARDARIYAEFHGVGMTDDGYHISAPLPEGSMASEAMRLACEGGGVSLGDVQYVNAHGTSTQLNDAMETRAIKATFGDQASRMMVSSTKSQIGHLLGASGAVEAVATVLALHQQVVPPTINYDEPDPVCDLDYVPNEPREANVSHALCNSFGFGGHNVSTLFGRLDD